MHALTCTSQRTWTGGEISLPPALRQALRIHMHVLAHKQTHTHMQAHTRSHRQMRTQASEYALTQANAHTCKCLCAHTSICAHPPATCLHAQARLSTQANGEGSVFFTDVNIMGLHGPELAPAGPLFQQVGGRRGALGVCAHWCVCVCERACMCVNMCVCVWAAWAGAGPGRGPCSSMSDVMLLVWCVCVHV